MKKSEEDIVKKQEIIDKVIQAIQGIGEELRSDTSVPLKEQASQVDVLLDTIHFLRDYDENVKVLNEYWLNKKHQEKFQINNER